MVFFACAQGVLPGRIFERSLNFLLQRPSWVTPDFFWPSGGRALHLRQGEIEQLQRLREYSLHKQRRLQNG